MPSVTPRRARNARGQGAQLRTELLDAALDLLRATGDPEDVSIRAVAKAAGVSPTAMYQHFTDREALLEAACERSFELFADFLLAGTSGASDPFERLALVGSSYLRYATEQPGLYRVLFSNPLHVKGHEPDLPAFPHDDSAGSNAFAVLVEIVADCLAAGAVTEETDAVYLSFQVWTWMHGIVDLHITHPAMPWPPADRMVRDVSARLGLRKG